MALIAEALQNAGYQVFLPQNDGLEFARLFPAFLSKGIQVKEAEQLLNRAIFALDVFQVKDSHGLVLNMNGRVPDEGAMVEAGVAWACQHPIVIYHNDDRSLIQGNSNPLVLGLADFATVNRYEDVAPAFDRHFEELGDRLFQEQASFTEDSLHHGQTISECLTHNRNEEEIANLLLDLFGGKTCQPTNERKENSTPAPTQP